MNSNFFTHRPLLKVNVLAILALLLMFSACRDKPEPLAKWDPYVPVQGADTTDLIMTSYINPGSDNGAQAVSFNYKSGDTSFLFENSYAVGKKITLMSAKEAAVTLQTVLADDTVAKYQFRLAVGATENSNDTNVFYIGLRLPKKTSKVDTTGIWIALKGSKLGLKDNQTGNVHYIDCGIDFTKERMFYIEDNMTTDVLTISLDGSNSNEAIAQIKIIDNNIGLYKPGQEQSEVAFDASGVLANGYFSCVANNIKTGSSYLNEIKINGFVRDVGENSILNMFASKDVFADTWVATDNENRFTGIGTGYTEDKKVGIFYFLWHDNDNNSGDGKIYNHSETYYKLGADGLKEVMGQGPIGFCHYWAEPYFGYYSSDDEWVIRKHTYQLVNAGIDFVFFDVTNGRVHEDNYELIFKVWTQMRSEGYETPQAVFHCGYVRENGQKSFKALWEKLYQKGRYKDLWFMHDGKPLIFLPAQVHNWDLSTEQRNFFTVRYSWANSEKDWYASLEGDNCWPWGDVYPQAPGKSPDGELEQMVVMSGYWANGGGGINRGRSYKNGKQPDNVVSGDFGFGLVDNGTSGKGYAFQEQFDYAIQQDPDIVMIIGWNEWWAGRWEAGNALGQTIANSYIVTDDNNWTRNYYVDCFNPEFSRDIEPVKGLYNDNYYYQMVMNLREYKGARQLITAFGQRPIVMSDPKSQWDIVGPEYRDYQGDITHRDAMSYVGKIHYTNTSGRNDIVVAKVSKYSDNLVFFVECANDITAAEGTNWMNLFIDSDAKASTGWYGYDYVINRDRDSSTCSIMQFKNNSWDMTEVGRAEYTVSGNYMQIKVDPSVIKVKTTFDFKWADNSVDSGDIMQFIDMGDSAPNDRFNYRYTSKKIKVTTPSVLTKDMVVLKAGSYYAYADGKMVRLDETTTKATFFGDIDKYYVPKQFATEVMKLDVSANTVYNHYGVEYVEISENIKSSGLVLSKTASLIVLSESAVSDEDLSILYSNLY